MSQSKRNTSPTGPLFIKDPGTSNTKQKPTYIGKDYEKYKIKKALKHLKTIDKREALQPYKHQRLGFEGVLIEVTPPNRKNGQSYGLVFASLYNPDRGIELDHAVVKVNAVAYESVKMELFTRYYFTAEIGSYYKTINLMGIPAKQEHYMLQKINLRKLMRVETSRLEQPTQYVRTRINNVILCKTKTPEHTEAELYTFVENQPNDGSKERFMEEYSQAFQSKSMSTLEVINKLYEIDK